MSETQKTLLLMTLFSFTHHNYKLLLTVPKLQSAFGAVIFHCFAVVENPNYHQKPGAISGLTLTLLS